MSKIKEVIVFTNGDSSKMSTWSNIPYFFTETLMEKGIRVNRVDISPDPRLKKLWGITIGLFIRMIFNLTMYDYFRSYVHFINVKFRIKKAIKSYPTADANIFLTFSFSSAGMTAKPTVLFCDWTFDHFFKNRLRSKPGLLEQFCIDRENEQIEAADLVISLFPGVADYMNNVYNNRIVYLGNVINSVYSETEIDAVKVKENSFDLLFVGDTKYIEGALSLIEAFANLKKDYQQLKLHIIGIDKIKFKSLPEDITCYGYLDKGRDDDRTVYYELLKRAKIFINTTPKWGAFSASIEAMYFYTPVIVSPYDEFVLTFGKNIDFGSYCIDNTPIQIEKSIKCIFDDSRYKSLCTNAHNSVREYTWSRYIDKIIQKIECI